MGKYQVCCHKDNTGNAPHKHFRQRHGKVNAVHPIICIWQEQKRCEQPRYITPYNKGLGYMYRCREKAMNNADQISMAYAPFTKEYAVEASITVNSSTAATIKAPVLILDRYFNIGLNHGKSPDSFSSCASIHLRCTIASSPS